MYNGFKRILIIHLWYFIKLSTISDTCVRKLKYKKWDAMLRTHHAIIYNVFGITDLSWDLGTADDEDLNILMVIVTLKTAWSASLTTVFDRRGI